MKGLPKPILKHIEDHLDPDDLGNFMLMARRFMSSSFFNEMKESMNLVKENYYGLSYCKIQTTNMCIEAVKKDGTCIIFVRNKKRKICLEAVKQNPYSIKHIENQTEELYLEAVKKDPHAIRFIKNPSKRVLRIFKKENYKLLKITSSKK